MSAVSVTSATYPTNPISFSVMVSILVLSVSSLAFVSGALVSGSPDPRRRMEFASMAGAGMLEGAAMCG